MCGWIVDLLLDYIRRYLSNKIGFIPFGVRMQKLLRFWFSGFWNFPDRKFRLAIGSSARAFLPPKVPVEVPGLLPLTLSNLLFWMCYLTELQSEFPPEVSLSPEVPASDRKFRSGRKFRLNFRLLFRSRSVTFCFRCVYLTELLSELSPEVLLPPEVPVNRRKFRP